jgi:hypothetical protein
MAAVALLCFLRGFSFLVSSAAVPAWPAQVGTLHPGINIVIHQSHCRAGLSQSLQKAVTLV